MNKEIEEEDKFTFFDASPIFPTKTSSRAEPLDTSGLQPFAEILANFLDRIVPISPFVNNLVPNVPF